MFSRLLINLSNLKALKQHIKPTSIPADHLAALDAWADIIRSGRVYTLKETALPRSPRPKPRSTASSILDGVGFHADTVEGLRKAFHEAVEDYIDTCAKIGKEPQKTYSGQVMFRISPDIHRKAALAAELSGKSLNQWAEEVLDQAAG